MMNEKDISNAISSMIFHAWRMRGAEPKFVRECVFRPARPGTGKNCKHEQEPPQEVIRTKIEEELEILETEGHG